MAIDIRCPGCGRTLRVGDQHAGHQVRCPACQQVCTAPAAGEPREAISPGIRGPVLGRTAAAWHMRTPEGSTYGPATWDELGEWASQGRIEADCELSQSAGGPWQRAGDVFPALVQATPKSQPTAPAMHSWTAKQVSSAGWSPPPASGSPFAPSAAAHFASSAATYVVPHRGGLILVLGLLGFVIGCPIFCLMAWVMGSHDLREMRAGRMDRSGEGLTQVGQILGMIQSLLWIGAAVLIMGLILLAAVAGA